MTAPNILDRLGVRAPRADRALETMTAYQRGEALVCVKGFKYDGAFYEPGAEIHLQGGRYDLQLIQLGHVASARRRDKAAAHKQYTDALEISTRPVAGPSPLELERQAALRHVEGCRQKLDEATAASQAADAKHRAAQAAFAADKSHANRRAVTEARDGASLASDGEQRARAALAAAESDLPAPQ